ncbi:MAG: hypothetical protein H3C47_14435 [Candidatus Cloacimonetes bacterium]|nr:hypothetical protein [Candidatus Cloacimonadota bacterium]
MVAPDLKFSGSICLQVPASEESRATDFLGQVYHLFKKQKVLLGAATGFGFGRFKCNEFTCSYYDLGNKSSLKKWLCKAPAPLEIKESELPIDGTRFSIKAKLRDSLLIRDSEGTADGPDAQHISWKKDSHYIPGTSLRGAIRARAEKILTVFVADPTKSENILRSIFGYVSTDSETEQKCSRGRLSVMDGKVEGVVSELQNRVSIDRFTGGARDGKLFDAKALFPDYKETSAGLCEFEFKLSADAKQVEVGLMLLTLLDFARGDFAVGGEKSIGRGRFDLQVFSVQSHGKNLMISGNDKSTGDIEYFQQCIQKLEQGL